MAPLEKTENAHLWDDTPPPPPKWGGYNYNLAINDTPLTPHFFYGRWTTYATISAPAPYNISEVWPATTSCELVNAVRSFLQRFWPWPLPLSEEVGYFLWAFGEAEAAA